jgi:ATP-dependent DNA ligase
MALKSTSWENTDFGRSVLQASRQWVRYRPSCEKTGRTPAEEPQKDVHIPGFRRHACKLGFEGIVSKRLGSPYISGRSRTWIKMKNPNAPAVKRKEEEEWGR